MSKMAVVGLEKHNRLSFSYPRAAFLLGDTMKPWERTFVSIRARCGWRGSRYYKKKIKNFLTLENVKFLWFRDKAYLMEWPSIDRKNNDKHYTLKNSRYIELAENTRRAQLGRKRKVTTQKQREAAVRNLMVWNKRKQ